MILAVCLTSPCARAQQGNDAPEGMSEGMQTAIHAYEMGDDVQAMDGFMDILTKGDPTERPMANDYLNLIAQRMVGNGAKGIAPAAKPSAPVIGPGPVSGPGRPASPPEEGPSERPPGALALRGTRVEEMSSANKALMRKEIRARLRAAENKSLVDLRELEGVRVVMRNNGDPAAIGIPTSLLFESGISFQSDAHKVLDPLTKLVFALGSTQVVILPEGTSLGDAKVLDMRRTMGVSAHLYQAGVAPPRVRVNLLSTQVDIPKALLDFRGVVIVFVYDQPMVLTVDSVVGDELGPPISLGVFPPQLRPSRNQGVIIEFSVSDPPVGLTSWKFQLLQPTADAAELAPLQEVVGGGPVFHQIFWNARQGYFGGVLPPGRYECVLSAIDAKNRRRTLHRWISVLADAGVSEKLLAVGAKASATASAAPAAAGAAPAAELPGEASKPLVQGVKPSTEVSATPPPAPRPKRKVAKRAANAKKRKSQEPEASDASGAPDAAASASSEGGAAKGGHYKLRFDKETHQLTDAAEKSLAKAARDFSAYPLETMKVVGHASADEDGASALAYRRATLVAGLLINRYQVEPKKIDVSSTTASGDSAMVELILARND